MKKFENTTLISATCNACGKELCVGNGMLKEGVFQANQEFGFFSDKDGMIHEFDMCEACYDRLIAGFKIPVMETEVKEFV